MNYTTILVKLAGSRGEPIDQRIVIRDNFAISTFSDPQLAYKVYLKSLELDKDVVYDDKLNAVIQKYPDMSMQEIKDELKAELERYGGKMVEND